MMLLVASRFSWIWVKGWMSMLLQNEGKLHKTFLQREQTWPRDHGYARPLGGSNTLPFQIFLNIVASISGGCSKDLSGGRDIIFQDLSSPWIPGGVILIRSLWKVGQTLSQEIEEGSHILPIPEKRERGEKRAIERNVIR